MAKAPAPIRPSAAIRTAYQKRLIAMVEEMHKSVDYWVTQNYRKNEPRIAADASAASELRRLFRKLGRRWLAQFDRLAPELADYFTTAASERVDGALSAMLRKGGFTVKFRMTAAQREAFEAVVGENVGLIKSIGAKYLTDVETAVMRSVATGRDLGTLSKQLQESYGVTKRRAALIARTQNNMATASLLRSRQKELGIKKARWLHSAGGKVPRPEHVAASGKLYDVDKGMFLEGKWTWPGVEINCRCVSVPVIPGFDA